MAVRTSSKRNPSIYEIAETKTADTIDEPCLDYKRMALRWEPISDQLGGTPRMRAAGDKWLPLEPKENTASWWLRLSRSVLFEALKKTINDTVSKPFSKPVQIIGEEDLPEKLAAMALSMDRRGRDITAFCSDVMREMVTYGHVHALGEFPRVQQNEVAEMPEQKLDLGAERDKKIHPYCALICARDLFWWSYVTTDTGAEDLTEIRIYERAKQPLGKFGEREVRRIRIYKKATWELHELNPDSNEWKQIAGGPNVLGRIPLVTYYARKTGFMTSEPPFEGLSWLGILHWQSSSDQRNLLRVARVPVLFRRGFTMEELEQDVSIGAGKVLGSKSKDADMKFVEHTGKAIDAGRADITAIEEGMEELGLEPFTQRSGDALATSRAIDESRSNAEIHEWIGEVETKTEELFTIGAERATEKLPEDFSIDVFSDFSIAIKGGDESKLLLEMRKARELSRKTHLLENKRRGILSDAVDVDAEIQAIEEETAKEADAMAKAFALENPDAGAGDGPPASGGGPKPAGGKPGKPGQKKPAAVASS